MKTYPSIERTPILGTYIYAFEKLDGSNMRVEWNRKNGFHKYGRRNGLLDDSNPILKKTIPLFEAKYNDQLEELFRKERWRDATVFMEFYGPNSFAGNHDPNDQHDVALLDVSVENRGIIQPAEFVKLFKYTPTAPLIYQGKWNQEMTKQVREGTFPGLDPHGEGLVCKGANVSPGRPLMFKVKSQYWLDRLRTKCGEDEQLFQQLV